MRKYVIGLIVAVIIPIVLELFIFSNEYVSNVTNDGWAGFFGGYIGGIATLLAVFLTIDDNRKILLEQRKIDKEKEEEKTRLGIMPYIQTSYNFYDEKSELSSYDIVCMLDDKQIKYTFTESERHILQCCKNNLEYCFLRYEIRNVGAGGAIEMTIKVNGEDYGIKHALPKNEKILLYIWKSMGQGTEYSITIDIDFWDTIMMGHYYRCEKFNVHATDQDMHISMDESYYVGQTLYEMK